jgi:hypothetical protein
MELNSSNNNDCANSACSSSTTSPGGDVATNYDDSLGKLSQASYIPNPGNGTNQSGDKPQEVLFIVTDGVEDERAAEAVLSRPSTTSAIRFTAIRRGQTGARRSKIAGSRLRSSIPTIWQFRPTVGTKAISRRSNRTSARRCRPAPPRVSSMTRRSGRTLGRRWRRCSPR